MAGGRIHAPHPTSLYPPLAISYKNHQKSMAYFSHLALLILFFLLKGRVKGGRGHGPIAHRHNLDVTNTQLRKINDTVHQRKNGQILLTPPEVRALPIGNCCPTVFEPGFTVFNHYILTGKLFSPMTCNFYSTALVLFI